MSAYLTVLSGGNQIGMFDGRHWSLNYVIKISREKHRIVELLGEEFEAFFPSAEGDEQPMEPLMKNIPRLLERIPQAMQRCEQGDEDDRRIILPFLKNLGPTLRRIQQRAPTGSGWSLFAD